jgi:hypothetical protein
MPLLGGGVRRCRCGLNREVLLSSAKIASRQGHLACLTYILAHEPLHLRPDSGLLRSAAVGGQVDCLRRLLSLGAQWQGDEDEQAAMSGNAAALEVCLVGLGARCNWDSAMIEATKLQSLECMQALYRFGYEQRRSLDGSFHPVVLAVSGGCVQCVEYALDRSGMPSVEHLDTAEAARAGKEMLQKVWEIGALHGLAFHPDTALEAARMGHVGALRYALQQGAPLDLMTFKISIQNGFEECLECAHKHATKKGFPEGYSDPLTLWDLWPETDDVAVLKYVFAHMGSLWTNAVAGCTAEAMANVARKLTEDPLCVENSPVNWEIVLLVARVLKTRLPRPLHELVRVRRERAAALAGVFYRFKQRHGPHSAALRNVLPDLSADVGLKIAVMAHLVPE